MNWFENINPIIQSLLATIFTWGVTAIGALIVCFFNQINKKVLDTVLGFGAGVMIAASFWSLLAPSLELASNLGYIVWLLPAIGFSCGGLFVLLADKLVDKILDCKKDFKDCKLSLKRSILLMVAITIHNIPEGLSIGVAFAGASLGIPGMTTISAIMLAIGIGVQNFPEGAAVSLPLRREGYSRLKSFAFGQASALVEPFAAVLGVVLLLFIRNILPFLLSFAAGSMIIVVARELLPESVKENKNLSTIGVIIGFILMMILDVSFSF